MFIELLLKEKPRSQCKVRYPEILAIVRGCFDEIDKVREMGYSWRQISKAMKITYPGLGIMPSWIKRYYERIKKEKNNHEQ
ncbi:MAG: hypothetical protein IJ859_09305 [Synergistaceae bacterium]|nr:hypothetical protein [Synergistaceae bacterium]